MIGSVSRAWRQWLGPALLLAALVKLLRDTASCSAPIDDAFISLRYARNLVEGHGLVFNIGERVEGITNLAWTLFLATGIAAGAEPLAFMRYLEIAAAVIAVLLTFGFAKCELSSRHSWLAGFAALTLVAGVSLSDWSSSGLGEPLYVAVVVAVFWASASGSPATTAILAFAATLVRPEGGLVAASALGSLWLAFPSDRRRIAAWTAVYGAAVCGLTGFRLLYYGSPVPNTFFAKVGGIPMSRGLAELRAFLAGGAILLVGPALAVAARNRRFWGIAFYATVTPAWIVYIGGDVFPNERFLLPVLALLSVLAALWIAAQLEGHSRWRIGKAVVVGLTPVLAFAALSAGFVPAGTPIWKRNATALRNTCAARARMHDQIKAQAERLEAALEDAPEGGLIGSPIVGALGWYARVRILDTLGITDAVVAHHRNELQPGALALPGHQRSYPDYVFRRAPDFLVMSRRQGTIPASNDIRRHPDFASLYEWDDSVKAFRRRTLFP